MFSFLLCLVWIVGLPLMILVVLSCDVAILILPAIRRYPRAYSIVMRFMVALAVGALLATALLVLIPEVTSYSFMLHSCLRKAYDLSRIIVTLPIAGHLLSGSINSINTKSKLSWNTENCATKLTCKIFPTLIYYNEEAQLVLFSFPLAIICSRKHNTCACARCTGVQLERADCARSGGILVARVRDGRRPVRVLRARDPRQLPHPPQAGALRFLIALHAP